MRIISDCHGKFNHLVEILQKTSDDVVQLGDLGFSDIYIKLQKYLGDFPHDFMVVGGNHEDYHCWQDFDFFLGDYGYNSKHDFFFVRGGYSVDKYLRISNDRRIHQTIVREELLTLYRESGHYSWFPQEELLDEIFEKCLQEYAQVKPEVMLTHDCPRSISNIISKPTVLRMFHLPDNFCSRTGQWLQKMLDVHRPRIWVFGHFHMYFDQEIDGTRFICRPELEYVDL